MLELLHGPDRTANSMELLARICENAAHGVAGQILIVPEQYSHETERALCERGGDTISRYAEVLSFTRLASRVFSVCGGVCEEYLDENGRILTLYLAAQQVREQLKFYAAVMTRPDFLKQLGALMEELLTSCVTPDALHTAAARLEGRLAQKITELALLYESYLSVCKTGRGDPVTRQMRLCELLDETEFLDGREVFLDGFSDFTALQMQIIRAILAHAKNVRVALLTSGGQYAACQTGNETEKQLRQLAARQGIETVRRSIPARAPRAGCAALAERPVFRRQRLRRSAAERQSRPCRLTAGGLRLCRAHGAQRRAVGSSLPRFYRLHDGRGRVPASHADALLARRNSGLLRVQCACRAEPADRGAAVRDAGCSAV